jgi:hypothetical protein
VTYRALVALSSDKSGRTWKPGDTVSDDDFPAAVIKNWLLIGALEVKDGGKS